MYGYIYETTNLVNGKKYIGQHRGNFNENYHGSGINICRAIEKYGEENFKTILIEECEDYDNLDKREIYWIAKYRKIYKDNLYNIADGGRVNRTMSGKRNPMHHSRYTFTKEHRKHLSESHLGKSSWIKGKHWTNKQKEILSKAAKNRKVNSTTGKISIKKDNTLKYIFPSDLDMYINNGWIKGNPKNESWQKNQSESRKNFYKIELNNKEIIVKGKDSIFSYLKENYNCVISGTEVKHLIRTGKEFIAHHSKHKILKGLKISRVEKR